MIIISFIIPVYNTARYLERCIGSILNQGIDESLFEIIVINDGSTDDSAQIIDSLVDGSHCIKSIHTENRGLGAARNKGMGMARGKYFFFVDSDDYLFDNSLAELFKYAELENFEIVGLNWGQVYPDATVIEKRRNISAYNLLTSGAEYLSRFNLSGGVCPYLFSASFLNKILVSMPEGIYHEDELFLSEVFTYARRVIFVDQLVYAYYQRDDSITNNKDAKQIGKRINDTLYILDRLVCLEGSEKLSELQKKGLRRKITSLTVDFIINLIRFRADKPTIQNMLGELVGRKLYPLPQMSYSFKYKIFRTVFNYGQNIVLASKLGLFKKT